MQEKSARSPKRNFSFFKYYKRERTKVVTETRIPTTNILTEQYFNVTLSSFIPKIKLTIPAGKTKANPKIPETSTRSHSSPQIPILKNNEILTIIEPRVFTKLTVGIGFPAGYIEKNENPSTGALRELREETGYVPKGIIEIDSFYQDEGISSAFNHIFIATDCEKKYEQELDKDEIVKYMTFTYEELLELEKLNYIKSANCKLALVKSKKYMKGR